METPPSVRIRIGDVLAGKYRVERLLGYGGMGIVVAATHLDLQELFAVKMLHPESMKTERAVERFMREARATIRLRSEHVARVFDVGRLDCGAPYMVMEHLSGSDLRDVIEERKRLPIHEAVSYVMMACEGLVEAHAAGIVHRDLKPANLFLTRRANGSACIKVLDFGISKRMVPGGDPQDMTRTREIVGSPLYMAPEQMRAGHTVDARTDIWALGVILYKLITGKPPFFAKTMIEVCAIVLERAAVPPSQLRASVSRGLDEIILRCLSKAPEQRFPSVTELAAALRPYARTGVFSGDSERISLLLFSSPDRESAAMSDARPLRSARRVSLLNLTSLRAPWPRPRVGSTHSLAIDFLALALGAVTIVGGGALVSHHEPPHAATPLTVTALASSSEVREAAVRAGINGVTPADKPAALRESHEAEDVSSAGWEVQEPRARRSRIPPSPTDPFGLRAISAP